jgi:hypothetical protein
MTWKAVLAMAIISAWLWVLITARQNEGSQDLLNNVTPIATMAVSFLLAEPVFSERRRRRQNGHVKKPQGRQRTRVVDRDEEGSDD